MRIHDLIKGSLVKLFVYEHITSGALANQDLPASLVHEGDEMLSAVLRDCHSLPNLDIYILRDARLSSVDIFDYDLHHHYHLVTNLTEFQKYWIRCLSSSDAILIIAPETNHVLANLQQQVVDHGKTNLGCQPAAIALATNKLDCDQQLNSHNITTPKSCLASHWPLQPFDHPAGYIVKPIDGAGCINTRIFDTLAELEHYLSQQPSELLQRSVIQSYIQGTPASLSLLVSSNDVMVLAINLQHIKREANTLIFNGCVVNGIDPQLFSLTQAAHIAQQIQQALPGLWGFVGVDLVITNNGAIVIDINPRLTTSYAGLHASLSINPMELLLAMKDNAMPIAHSITERKHVNIVV